MKKLLLSLAVFLVIFFGETKAQVASSESYLLEAGDWQAIDIKADSQNFQLEGGSQVLGYDAYTYFMEGDQGMFANLNATTAAHLRPSLSIVLDKVEVELRHLLVKAPPIRNPFTVQAQTAQLSQSSADISGLTPGIMAQTSSNVIVNSNAPAGYQLYVQENHQPILSNKNFDAPMTARNSLLDTSCDDGLCTINQAGLWENQSVPGFGYSVSGLDSLADFGAGTKFRPFANQSKNEAAVLIAEASAGAEPLINRQTQIIYRAGASADNEAGIYTNTISYTFVPSL